MIEWRLMFFNEKLVMHSTAIISIHKLLLCLSMMPSCDLALPRPLPAGSCTSGSRRVRRREWQSSLTLPVAWEWGLDVSIWWVMWRTHSSSSHRRRNPWAFGAEAPPPKSSAYAGYMVVTCMCSGEGIFCQRVSEMISVWKCSTD